MRRLDEDSQLAMSCTGNMTAPEAVSGCEPRRRFRCDEAEVLVRDSDSDDSRRGDDASAKLHRSQHWHDGCAAECAAALLSAQASASSSTTRKTAVTTQLSRLGGPYTPLCRGTLFSVWIRYAEWDSAVLTETAQYFTEEQNRTKPAQAFTEDDDARGAAVAGVLHSSQPTFPATAGAHGDAEAKLRWTRPSTYTTRPRDEAAACAEVRTKASAYTLASPRLGGGGLSHNGPLYDLSPSVRSQRPNTVPDPTHPAAANKEPGIAASVGRIPSYTPLPGERAALALLATCHTDVDIPPGGDVSLLWYDGDDIRTARSQSPSREAAQPSPANEALPTHSPIASMEGTSDRDKPTNNNSNMTCASSFSTFSIYAEDSYGEEGRAGGPLCLPTVANDVGSGECATRSRTEHAQRATPCPRWGNKVAAPGDVARQSHWTQSPRRMMPTMHDYA